MIPSLPLLNETTLEFTQTNKLALAFLKKISSSVGGVTPTITMTDPNNGKPNNRENNSLVQQNQEFSSNSYDNSSNNLLAELQDNHQNHGTQNGSGDEEEASSSSYSTAEEDNLDEVKIMEEQEPTNSERCDTRLSIASFNSFGSDDTMQTALTTPIDYLPEQTPFSGRSYSRQESNDSDDRSLFKSITFSEDNEPLCRVAEISPMLQTPISVISNSNTQTEIDQNGNHNHSHDKLCHKKSDVLMEYEHFIKENILNSITVAHVQEIFNCFKNDDLSFNECEYYLNLLDNSESRIDYQWALHQIGGFNAILFLYARVIEIFDFDYIQSRALELVLNHLKNHHKPTDGPTQGKKNLIRFALNSAKSCFGFETFIMVVRKSLNPKGNRIEDYELLDMCLVSSWKKMLRVRCTENDSPSGDKTLFECLLSVVLDLCSENNPNREINIGTLKLNGFIEMILSICNHLSSEAKVSNLNLNDALRISGLMKSLLSELMAPPDAEIAVAIVKYVLLPLLPKELPPLPRKEDAFFLFHGTHHSSLTNLKNITEAEEVFVSSEHHHNHPDLVLSESSNRLTMQIDDPDLDVPEVIGVGSTVQTQNQKLSITSMDSEFQSFTEIFHDSLLEAAMSVLLDSFSLISDEGFKRTLGPHLNTHIFISYCSHSNPSLQAFGLQLLSAYLSRVKNPILTEFIKCKGFFLTSCYTQGNPELSNIVLQICTLFGPVSYSLATGLIYSNTVVNNLIQWIHHDEVGVVSALYSMGFLPSVLNYYKSSSQLPRPLLTLISLMVKFCALNPKEDPWKILFCPGIESAPKSHFLIARILQESTEMLRKYNPRERELKKSEASARLLWLIERSTGSRLGHQLDKWLLQTFSASIMELDESQPDETETWKYFVKKNKRRLIWLMGLFLCKIFAPNKGELEFKQYTIRFLVLTCPNLAKWLPKVIRTDDQVERCFTAFVRVFLLESETRSSGRLDPRLRRPSFHSLISSNSNIVMSLRNTSGLGLSPVSNEFNDSTPDFAPNPPDPDVHLSDRAVRTRFETLLIDSGILSPTNNFSTNSSSFASTPDFKTFRMLLEATPISGVSHQELRQCLATVDKMRSSLLLRPSLSRKNSSVGLIKIQNNPSTNSFFQISNTSSFFDSTFETVHNVALDVLNNVTRLRTRQEIDVARKVSARDEDVRAKEEWWNLRESMTHPKAPWHFPNLYPKFWSLEQTEGPGRIRTRLQKEHLKIHPRFVKPENRDIGAFPIEPVDFLFQFDSQEYLSYPILKSDVRFIRFCVRIIPGEELPGEVIITDDSLYFFCEACQQVLNHCSKVNVLKTSIYTILRRRYTLEDRAAEVFVDNQSYLFVFRTQRDREEFIQIFANKQGIVQTSTNWASRNSVLMNSSLATVSSQWAKGILSNFDYLMYLNTAAGRTYCDLMQYPVFPFVLSKYESQTLDLHASPSYRDLKKPMAIQDPVKEKHFVSTYNYLKRECDSTPFHYGSHYSNSGIVLHFLVRLPPYTQHFLKYQDGSFDIPDRSFHSIETTWRLASKESNTDFKEAIPEFYYLPEFMQNLQHFDLGVRQNGVSVDDVQLPPWANGNPRIFTLVNRQALENQETRRYLGDWIDLIFGYKQTGKAAVHAINVFHPSTYEGFEVDGDGADDLIQRARKAMVSTYGQTPKKLFQYPHPKPQLLPNESCEQQAIETVYGIRWGEFVGSPASPDVDVISTKEYREPIELFETNSRIVFWPQNTLILGDSVVGTWDSTGVKIKTNIVYLCIGDEITVCTGIENSLWIGHQSGRITYLKLNQALDKVIETIDLIGHYKPIKSIDLNQEFSIAVSCSGENYALIWDMNRITYANVIENLDPIDFVYSSRSTGDIVLLNYELNRIYVKTINGFEIGNIDVEEKIESVCISGVDPGKNVNLIAVGCNYGIVKFYSSWDLRLVNQVKILPVWTLPIKSVRYSKDGRRLYCMSLTEERYITVALQLTAHSRRLSFI